MKLGKGPGSLRDFRFYIITSLKFFELKDEYLTPIIFTISLLISFSSAFLPVDFDITAPAGIFYNILTTVIMYLITSIYLSAYIRELKNEEYNLGICTKLVLKRIFKILVALIIYILSIAMGAVLLVVPGIILYLMFIFNACLIIDTNEPLIASFTLSKRLTDGKKTYIFSLMLLFNLLLFMPVSFTFLAAMSSNSNLIFNFITSFVSVIVNIMQQRMIALMYVDLRYGINSNRKIEYEI